MIENLIEIDKQIFIFLNNLGSETWDFFWLFLSNRMVMFCIIMLFVIYHCYKIEIKKSFFIISFFIICLGITDFLHVLLFKNLFMRLRPCWETDIVSQIRPLLLDCGGQYGFISGHAANSAAMVTFLIYSFKNMNKFLKYILLIWVLFVSYSRIYLAKHYPLDIVVGIAFGCLIGVLTFNIYQIYLNQKNSK
tara:strand:+ start:94 stop:669 length:576 start_codon:yes stop_codon:yes gene_type:complete